MMDTRKGYMVTGKDEEDLLKKAAQDGIERMKAQQRINALDGVFRVGEELTIRQSRFRVEDLTRTQMILELLPRVPTEEAECPPKK